MLKNFGHFERVHLIFDKILSSRWQILCTFGQIFKTANDQTLNIQSTNLVTLPTSSSIESLSLENTCPSGCWLLNLSFFVIHLFCIFDAFCIIRFREMKYGWDTNPRYLVSTSICPTNCATTIVLRFTLNNLRHKLSPTKHWPRALCSIHSLSGQILSLLFLLSWLSLVRQSMFIQNDFVECFKQAKVISIKIIMPLRTPFDDKELDNGSPLVEQKHCYC